MPVAQEGDVRVVEGEVNGVGNNRFWQVLLVFSSRYIDYSERESKVIVDLKSFFRLISRSPIPRYVNQ